MKRILYIIGIALAAIGCAKDETADFANLDGVINFTAGLATRVAESDDCAWAENDEVGVFTDQTGEANLKFTISDTETGAMEGEDLYVLASGTRTYYAYHPYDSEQSTTTINIDCTEDQSNPLLWATATSNDANVAFQFSHKLVKVELTLTAGGMEVTSLKGAKATLTSVNTKATFDIESGEFSDETASGIVFDDIDDDYNITLYLPPMDEVSDNVKLWITAEDNTYLKTFDTETWESGNSYVYDIIVGEPIPDYTNEGDNYYIYTAEGLTQFASLVNGGNYSINGMLMRDIDLGDDTWTPIGSSENIQYKGTFDGGGHLVSGLKVSSGQYTGLFGYTAGSAKIYNLGVDGAVYGDVACGGVVGYNGGTITNCYNKGSMSGDYYAGGVAGINAGTIINCYNKGSMSCSYSAGGVVGYYMSGTITNCYSTGAVSGKYVGGVAGESRGTNMTNCYWDSSTADSGVGTGDDTTTEMTTDAMQDGGFVRTLNNNAYTYNNPTDGDKPTVKACAWVAVSNDYPTFNFDADPTYTPDIELIGDVYYINAATGLETFATLVSEDPSINCTLINYIDLGDVEWTPIGSSENPYSGTFDGGGYLVSGLKVSSGTYAGFFGCTDSGAEISNLGVDGSVSGTTAGGVVGYNNGGNVTNCYNIGSVSGDSYIGGVVGENYDGTITNCYNMGGVNGGFTAGGVVGRLRVGTITNCYNSGDVSADSNAGGVVGTIYEGTITNCYNIGGVNGEFAAGGVVGWNFSGTITNSYNMGTVSSAESAGGVVGHNSGTITNCYWDSEVYNGNGVGSGGGTTTEMTTDAMQDGGFVITLNNNAYTYNNPTDGDKPIVKACAWVAVSNDYPTLDFDATPIYTADITYTETSD